MGDDLWTNVAGDAVERLGTYGPVIMMGLEGASRQVGERINRKEFVGAKSVYALLKTTFEREQDSKSRDILELFVKEPDKYKKQMLALLATKAENSPHEFGRKLVALTNRWRTDKRPLPPATKPKAP